jgi:hypothetical protein
MWIILLSCWVRGKAGEGGGWCGVSLSIRENGVMDHTSETIAKTTSTWPHRATYIILTHPIHSQSFKHHSFARHRITITASTTHHCSCSDQNPVREGHHAHN